MIKLIAVDMDGTFLRDDKTYDREKFARIYQELEKKSFKVDLGYTETDAVRLVDIEDILVNQFKQKCWYIIFYVI